MDDYSAGSERGRVLAENLVQKVVAMALAGDVQALRICVERLIPPLKDAPLDRMIEGTHAGGVGAQLAECCGGGEITPLQGSILLGDLKAAAGTVSGRG